MPNAEERRARESKIERLRSGGAPRVLELCSGCGGLSLGLQSAGFQLVAHVEHDMGAAETYALNFATHKQRHARWAEARDMEVCSANELVQDLGLTTEAIDSFDVVVAGLPCQAFARIGRSKLRAVAGEKDAFKRDTRAALYVRFLEYVADTQPLAIIIENVPDILNFGGHNVPEGICDTLEAAGYKTSYTLLNSAFYGVPQVRERFFLIAIASELNIAPTFPGPTHYFDLPRGYEGSRKVALKHVQPNNPRFAGLAAPTHSLPSAIGTLDALHDLPRIEEHRTERATMRRRKVRDRLPYRTCEGLSDYAKQMRHWPGFENESAVDGNVVRLTPRDFAIFEKMPCGADYPQARRIAEEMFRAELERLGLTDLASEADKVAQLRKAMVPPYDPAKFPNKWWKLDPVKPSRTLTAHMGKDTYSHIHYDSSQQRMVSVREAARLQSFPDGFKFAGEMNASFRQIGNAVPPLLGKAIAVCLKNQLDSTLRADAQVEDKRAA